MMTGGGGGKAEAGKNGERLRKQSAALSPGQRHTL